MKTRQEIERIARQKKRIRAILITAAILAVLVAAASVLLVYFLNTEDTGSTVKEKPEIIDGEAYYRNYAIAYPQVLEKDITRVTVSNVDEDGNRREYMIIRADVDSNGELVVSSDTDFKFSYVENGEAKLYYPSILALESDFKYSDLYAKETGDGYGTINKITYLLSGLEIPYFGERIKLSADAKERAQQLRIYGFSDDDPVQKVVFEYRVQTAGADTETTDDDKYKTEKHTVKIGKQVLSGTGYYFMVDDREYVYNSNSNYYDYALMGFYSFVNGRLLAAGLEEDSTYEPTLVSDFTHWKNELYKEGEVFGEGSRVILLSDAIFPVNPHAALNSSEYRELGGYVREDTATVSVDLGEATSVERDALLGKKVGSFASGELVYTLTGSTESSKEVTFDLDGDVVYNYNVTAIDSIVDVEMPDGSRHDITKAGELVGDNRFIKIVYNFDINGDKDKIYNFDCYAVIDLENSTLPAEAVAALRAAKTGELDKAVEFSIRYNENNSTLEKNRVVITEIISIFDQNGADVKTVNENSIVAFRYHNSVIVRYNGEESVVNSESETYVLNLKTASSANDKKIKEALLGKKVSKKLEIVPIEATSYYEVFHGFESYEVKEIKYFVTEKEIVSFSFLNNSERDPFFGESIYENNTDGYELYGLESANCEQIVRALGGVIEGNSTSSAGLVGETVDVGITPEKMEKYGLYEHTLYFEMPRGVIVIDSGEDDVVDDYSSYSSLGTTLYISREDSDGMRTVGSDTFDVIAKVDGEIFDFLEENFVDLWARKNLVMTDVKNIEELRVEFSMKDLVGKYEFDISHRTGYIIVKDDGTMGQVYNEPENYMQTYDNLIVKVTPSGTCTPNVLTKYLDEKGRDSTTLTTIYNNTVGGGTATFVENSYDTLGTGSFKEAMLTLFYVKYQNSIPEDEQINAIENGERVMKFSLKIGGSSYRYSYEFYRFDDRRVLVRQYQEGLDGKPVNTPVSDFYVSTFGFKKIVGTFLSLLNGQEVDLDATFYELPTA